MLGISKAKPTRAIAAIQRERISSAHAGDFPRPDAYRGKGVVKLVPVIVAALKAVAAVAGFLALVLPMVF